MVQELFPRFEDRSFATEAARMRVSIEEMMADKDTTDHPMTNLVRIETTDGTPAFTLSRQQDDWLKLAGWKIIGHSAYFRALGAERRAQWLAPTLAAALALANEKWAAVQPAVA